MKINRRDVVGVVFGSKTKHNHSVIVLSPEEINTTEGQFLGIMITDSVYYDTENEFSFPLNDTMFIKPMKEKSSRVRLYLVNFLPQSVVVDLNVNQMKLDAFKEMVKHLNEKIFGVTF